MRRGRRWKCTRAYDYAECDNGDESRSVGALHVNSLQVTIGNCKTMDDERGAWDEGRWTWEWDEGRGTREVYDYESRNVGSLHVNSSLSRVCHEL